MRIKTILILGILGLALAGGAAWVQTRPVSVKHPGDSVRPESHFYTGEGKGPRRSHSYISYPRDSYRFDPALQGDKIEHDFLMKNTTDVPMEFGRVTTCCGVILTRHSPVILPGEEGRFTVLIFTDKYGGKTIHSTLSGELLDPEHPPLSVSLTLDVERFAGVSQHKIILQGSCRTPLYGESLVVPEADHPFHVTGIKTKKGLHIAAEVLPFDARETKGYRIRVQNLKQTPGVYRDMVFVTTDNPDRPELRIRVEGRLSE